MDLGYKEVPPLMHELLCNSPIRISLVALLPVHSRCMLCICMVLCALLCISFITFGMRENYFQSSTFEGIHVTVGATTFDRTL